MVHSHGAKTMMHICGCAERFLPRLAEIGLDVYDVVQPTTPQMDIAVLQKKFGRSIDVLRLGLRANHDGLGHGRGRETRSAPPARSVSPRRPVSRSHARHPSRLAAGKHPGIVQTAGSLAEKVDETILSAAADGAEPDKISLSKLF